MDIRGPVLHRLGHQGVDQPNDGGLVGIVQEVGDFIEVLDLALKAVLFDVLHHFIGGAGGPVVDGVDGLKDHIRGAQNQLGLGL